MSLFAMRLKNLRREKGEYQEQVARFLGVQRATYSGYERGVIVPPYEKINKLSEHFGVSVDYLMGKTDFETYDTPVMDIPDVAEQLMLISDELKSEVSAVKCNGVRLTEEEKKTILPFVTGCIKLAELLANKKDKELK